MRISIRDIFRKGELWSNLEETIGSIKKSLTQHSKSIEKSKSNDIILMQNIKKLEKENSDLRNRMVLLENRLWDLKVVSNSNDAIIVKDAFENSNRPKSEVRANKA
ncbi:hypothetical protein KDW99_09030 [Marinomonas rhizomae]|uniref:hypothetical protein n=1 Tax=Marinomonas rhizomae TaxID=491948 RepID=UPI0021046E75|nr:hypothetical protein [Marinomonas rhizomae]UTW01251.1 hypothetical protein KDW99_09030 [Marinomonas rhizomae]